MTFLDAFLTDPDDPAERAQAQAVVAEIRSHGPLCDCDRADPRDPHESWCPAIRERFCTDCLSDHDPRDCRHNPDQENDMTSDQIAAGDRVKLVDPDSAKGLTVQGTVEELGEPALRGIQFAEVLLDDGRRVRTYVSRLTRI